MGAGPTQAGEGDMNQRRAELVWQVNGLPRSGHLILDLRKESSQGCYEG